MVFSIEVRKSMLEWLSEGWRPHLKPFYSLSRNKWRFLSLKNLGLYTDPVGSGFRNEKSPDPDE